MYSYKNAYRTLYNVLKELDGNHSFSTEAGRKRVISRYALKKRKDYKQCSTAEEFLVSLINDKEKIIAAIREDAELFKNGDPAIVESNIDFYANHGDVNTCHIQFSTKRHGNSATEYIYNFDFEDAKFSGFSNLSPTSIEPEDRNYFLSKYCGADKMPIMLRRCNRSFIETMQVYRKPPQSILSPFMKSMGCCTDADEISIFNELKNPDSTVYFECSLFGITYEELIIAVLYDYSTCYHDLAAGTCFQFSTNIFEVCL